MTLRLRHLRLRAVTGEGLFGADIPLSEGLVVLRAENSRGKSTAVQSVLFALGLERMITTRPTNAVTSAMRDRLIYDPATKRETAVLSSWVSVEIEGVGGQVATVTRWVKDAEIEPALVRVSHGPELTQDDDYPTEDYYVGIRGGASNPRGFHTWLAEFIGWSMPELPAREGRTSPLYMEQVFPLLFVEQRRGWGGIQAQMPIFSGVSEVRKRAIEFLLALDVGQNQIERQRLRAEESELQDAWRTKVRSFTQSLEGDGLVAVALHESAVDSWPPRGKVPYLAEPADDEKWLAVDDVVGALHREDAALAAQVDAPADVNADVRSALAQALEESNRLRQQEAVIRDDLVRQQAEARSIAERLTSLREDLRQHQDVATLERLGSTTATLLHDDCPVCHQALPASLVPGETPAMTATESVDYIRQQIELFETMETDSEFVLRAKRERWNQIRQDSNDVASRFRAMRESLVGPQAAPPVDAIARRIRIAERITRLRSAVERFDALAAELERMTVLVREVRARLKELPRDSLSEADEAKLRHLNRVFVEQLRAYDFGSFSDERLSISKDDYLPRREEFDLQADISASDSIRVIWAYLLGLLEVSSSYAINHPGLLIFDEPKQQSAKDLSFAALLRRAAADSENRQIVFATSESLDSLSAMLSDVPHRLLVVDGYMLKPVDR